MKRTFYLEVDYEECKPETYKGVFVREGRKEILRVNMGDVDLDLNLVYEILVNIIDEEYNTCEMSSIDHFYMDCEYENNPEYKSDVDKDYEQEMKVKEAIKKSNEKHKEMFKKLAKTNSYKKNNVLNLIDQKVNKAIKDHRRIEKESEDYLE